MAGGLLLAAVGVLLIVMAFNKSWTDAFGVLLTTGKAKP